MGCHEDQKSARVQTVRHVWAKVRSDFKRLVKHSLRRPALPWMNTPRARHLAHLRGHCQRAARGLRSFVMRSLRVAIEFPALIDLLTRALQVPNKPGLYMSYISASTAHGDGECTPAMLAFAAASSGELAECRASCPGPSVSVAASGLAGLPSSWVPSPSLSETPS